MKKKLLVLLMATTMMASLLAGCGSKDATPITVSEMLDKVLEENGGSIYIYTSSISGHSFDELISTTEYTVALKPTVYKYDGTNICTLSASLKGGSRQDKGHFESATVKGNTLDEGSDELVKNFDKNIDSMHDDDKPQASSLTIDSDGVEILPSEAANGSDRIAFYDDFYHIENRGISYMVFHAPAGNPPTSNVYIFIKDTDYTIDKTVVPDTDL